MVDPVVNYADLATVQTMLSSTGSVYDPATTARLTSLIEAISRLIEDVLGRSFGQPGPDTTVLVWARGGNQLILPKPAWSITSITTGGTVLGDEMSGGTGVTTDQWVVGIEDQNDQILALDSRSGWWGAGVPVSVTGQFCDVDRDSTIPADLALAANQLVCETYKLQNLPVVTDDGVVVPRRDPWADPFWLKVKEKYEISARELVV